MKQFEANAHNQTLEITDQRQIAGILKEALFCQRMVILRHISEIDFEIEAEFITIDERSGRDTANDRTAVLKTTRKSIPPSLKHVEATIFFPRFVVSGNLNIIEIKGNEVRCSLPKSLHLSDKRNKYSVRLSLNKQSRSEVLVESANSRFSASFSPRDISQSGLGGDLLLPKEIPITLGSLLTGVIRLEETEMHLNAFITWMNLLREDSQYAIYRVGLIQSLEEHDNPFLLDSSAAAEKRKLQRRKTNREIVFKHPFHLGRIIEGVMRDCSIAGLNWEPLDPTTVRTLSPGIILELENSDLKVKVLGLNARGFRCEIIDGREEARIQWLKSIGDSISKDSRATAESASEIISLFCTSGALASGYLSAQRVNADKIHNSITQELGNEPWLQRWLEYGESGSVKGHIGGMKVADSLWYLCDLAGSLTPGERISKSLAPKFLHSMAMTLKRCSPMPALMMIWLEGHPYWQSFREAMHSDTYAKSVITWLKCAYFRASTSTPTRNATFECSKIYATDFSRIAKIHNKLESAHSIHARYLDFDERTFGSPNLAKLIQTSKMEFKRVYFEIHSPKINGLAIIQAYPAGASVTRTPEVAWFYPFTGTTLDDRSCNDLLSELKAQGALEGIDVTGMLVPSLAGLGSATKLLNCSLLHPDAYDYYREATWTD